MQFLGYLIPIEKDIQSTFDNSKPVGLMTNFELPRVWMLSGLKYKEDKKTIRIIELWKKNFAYKNTYNNNSIVTGNNKLNLYTIVG